MGTCSLEHALPHASETLAAIGERLGAIVRADVGHPSIVASILIGHEVPVLTINVAAMSTPAQEVATDWAAEHIRQNVPGFYLCRDG